MPGLTSQLAAFAARPGFDRVPDEAIRIVRAGFIDTIATMLAGRDEPVTRLVRDACARQALEPRGGERSAR